MTSSPSSGVRLPVLGLHVSPPSRASMAWYAGLGAVAALELVEWPVALLIAASHAISDSSRDPAVSEAAGGAGSGA